MRIEEIAGQRIRQRREELGRTQEGLGKAIGERLGREWPRQAVSAAEHGKRSFTAAELVAIAHVLGTNVQQLLTPPAGIEKIELADDVTIDRALLAGALAPGRITDRGQEKLQEAFSRLLVHVSELGQAADDVHQDMNLMRELSLAVYQEEGNAAPALPIVAAIITSPLGVLIERRHDGNPCGPSPRERPSQARHPWIRPRGRPRRKPAWRSASARSSASVTTRPPDGT